MIISQKLHSVFFHIKPESLAKISGGLFEKSVSFEKFRSHNVVRMLKCMCRSRMSSLSAGAPSSLRPMTPLSKKRGRK